LELPVALSGPGIKGRAESSVTQLCYAVSFMLSHTYCYVSTWLGSGMPR
jgi:hypothetical protein